MKFLRNFAFVAFSLLTSQIFAMDLKVTVDSKLLTPGNSMEVGCRLITCGGKAICPANSNNINESITEWSLTARSENAPRLLTLLEDTMKGQLPAHSNQKNQDSYIKLDIINNKKTKLNLPNCTKVINGLKSLKINVTPTGCTYS